MIDQRNRPEPRGDALTSNLPVFSLPRPFSIALQSELWINIRDYTSDECPRHYILNEQKLMTLGKAKGLRTKRRMLSQPLTTLRRR